MAEDWTTLIDLFPTFAFRLGISALCGILLGLERERKDKPAGLRTIILITVGATLYMLIGSLIPFIADWPTAITRSDPSRIAGQVVTGIGFLGAGTIIHARGSVHGLTTAAVIWVAAAIGLCAGIGYPLLALCVTLLVLAALVALRPLHDWLARRAELHEVTLLVPDDSLAIQRIRYTLRGHDMMLEHFEVHRQADALRVTFSIRAHAGAAGRLLEALSAMAEVRGTTLQGAHATPTPTAEAS